MGHGGSGNVNAGKIGVTEGQEGVGCLKWWLGLDTQTTRLGLNSRLMCVLVDMTEVQSQTQHFYTTDHFTCGKDSSTYCFSIGSYSTCTSSPQYTHSNVIKLSSKAHSEDDERSQRDVNDLCTLLIEFGCFTLGIRRSEDVNTQLRLSSTCTCSLWSEGLFPISETFLWVSSASLQTCAAKNTKEKQCFLPYKPLNKRSFKYIEDIFVYYFTIKHKTHRIPDSISCCSTPTSLSQMSHLHYSVLLGGNRTAATHKYTNVC